MQSAWLALGLLITQALWLGLYLAVGVVLTVVVFGFDFLASATTYLLDTWILQTIVGAWVALTFQKATASDQRKLDNLNKSYERKVSATKATLTLIDQRAYASRRYLHVIESEPENIETERAIYTQSVRRWNEELKTHQISILIDFDAYFGLEFDHFYSPKFLEIDALLRKQRLSVQSGRLADPSISKEIRRRLFQLNKASLDMMRMMLRIAKNDRNVLDQNVEIKPENLSQLTYRDLLSALFGLRKQS